MLRSNVRARILVVLFAIAAAAIGACSLNPQPIPPGAQDNGASEPSPSADASVNKNSSDAGGGDQFADAAGAHDGAGTVSDAEQPVPFTDAAVDADAGDAEVDAAEDAAADANDGAPE